MGRLGGSGGDHRNKQTNKQTDKLTNKPFSQPSKYADRHPLVLTSWKQTRTTTPQTTYTELSNGTRDTHTRTNNAHQKQRALQIQGK